MSAEGKRFSNQDVSETLARITETPGIAEHWLAAIIENSEDAIISKDLNSIIMSWNPGAQRLFGYAEQEVIGKPVTILVPADRHDEEPEILSRIRRGERIEPYETVRQRKDGSFVDVSLSVSPIVDQDGRIVGASKIARNITAQKAADRLKDTLVGEMKHRVKNSLTLAASIAAQTFQSATDEERETFTSRLRTLGDAHDILSKQTWERAGLREVVARAVEPHHEGQRQISISGPDINVDARKSVALALALHELATNAVKYGALSQPEGTVVIEWGSLDGEPDMIRLRWEEHGGPAVEQPEHNGFGSRLIRRGLAAEFDAVELDFLPAGVTCTLTFPHTVRATTSPNKTVPLSTPFVPRSATPTDPRSS